MNLTIEQVSKLTKLSIPTLHVYTSRQRLGTKVGNKRVFSQTDVQKILKGSTKAPAKKKAKLPTKKRSRRTIKAEPIVASNSKPKAVSASTPTSKPTKQSLWTRLFRGRNKVQKVSLLEAGKTK